MNYRILPKPHECFADCGCGAERLARAAFAELDVSNNVPSGPVPAMAHRLVDPRRRILLRGGTVLSMDATIGDYPRGDVLIEGSRIIEVGAGIEATAIEIDASDMIVLPGFCDPHIHCWQGALGRLIPNNTSTYNEECGIPVKAPHPTRSYQNVLHNVFAPIFRPEDMYVGTLLTLVGAMSGGITTVCDNAHNSRSPEHSDACVTALIDSGIRGIHAYGRPRTGTYGTQFPQDAYRLRKEYFSADDQLVGLRMYMLGRDPMAEFEQVVRIRQELDLWISFDSGLGEKPLDEFYRKGWFDGRETVNHGNFISADQRALIVAHGTQINVCPRIEAQFRFGHVPYQDWVDSGLKPAISNDDPATFAVNMFSEMQCLYAFQRAKALSGRLGTDQGPPALATLREMLEAATIRGAENCGLAHRVGSLTPGKQADIIMIDTRNEHLSPVNNAFCSTVQGATPHDVKMVMIGGRLVKWDGQMIGVDVPKITKAASASQAYLFEAARWPLHLVDVTD